MAGSEIAGAADVVVPAEQEGTKASLKAWLKRAGDEVSKDEPILELESDKVVFELPAPCSGVLAEILVDAGADVKPGTVVGRISTPLTAGDPAPELVSDSSANESPPRRPGPALDPQLRLSPSVRKLVAEHNVDLTKLIGTGKDGRVTREDVVAWIERTSQVRPTAPPAGDKSTGACEGAIAPLATYRIAHGSIRRAIAEHMQRSLSIAPHVTAVLEADFSAIAAHRRANLAAFASDGVSLTYTAYIVAACVTAMAAAPKVNGRWHEDFIEVFSDVNVGVGTALADSGLIVPVIHKAQELSLIQIAGRLQDLTRRAREGRLKPADVQHGTFSISNYGVSGSLLAAPIIINQPQSAILGVGAIQKRVAVRTIEGVDSLQIRPMAYVSLTIDHRVVDGAETNAWLRRFVDTLEAWAA